MKEDSSAFVIKVNEFFSSDIPMIGALRDSERKRFKIKGIENKIPLVYSVVAEKNNSTKIINIF